MAVSLHFLFPPPNTTPGTALAKNLLRYRETTWEGLLEVRT
jgi:hypothetical protein